MSWFHSLLPLIGYNQSPLLESCVIPVRLRTQYASVANSDKVLYRTFTEYIGIYGGKVTFPAYVNHVTGAVSDPALAKLSNTRLWLIMFDTF